MHYFFYYYVLLPNILLIYLLFHSFLCHPKNLLHFHQFYFYSHSFSSTSLLSLLLTNTDSPTALILDLLSCNNTTIFYIPQNQWELYIRWQSHFIKVISNYHQDMKWRMLSGSKNYFWQTQEVLSTHSTEEIWEGEKKTK